MLNDISVPVSPRLLTITDSCAIWGMPMKWERASGLLSLFRWFMLCPSELIWTQVRATYAVAYAYVFADTAQKTNKVSLLVLLSVDTDAGQSLEAKKTTKGGVHPGVDAADTVQKP